MQRSSRDPAVDQADEDAELRGLALERELPRLCHEIQPVAAIRLLVRPREAGLFVDAARASEMAMGKKRELAIARLPREPYALVDQPLADPGTSSRRLDIEKAQLGYLGRFLYEDHRPYDLAVFFGDPASFARRIVTLQELGRDLRNQRLEPRLIAELLCVKRAMAVNDPSMSPGCSERRR
jgi:hypothetical protein